MQSTYYRLIIDTSSEQTILGIARKQEILASQISLHANKLSQSLMPDLQQLLQQAGLTLKQIDEIAVGIGPGSYTGTRVGVAVAKSLHFALNRPLLKGFCSLLAYIPPFEGEFACVMPSKTGDFYLLKGVRSPENLICSQSELIDRSTLCTSLTGVDLLIAKPLDATRSLLPEFAFQWTLPLPTLSPIIDYLESLPSAEALLKTDLIYLHKP